MFSIIIKIICFVLGMLLFYGFSLTFNKAFNPELPVQNYNHAGFLAAGFLLGMLVAPYAEQWILQMHRQVLRSMQRFSPHTLASGFIGLLMGFLFSVIVTLPLWLFLKHYLVLTLAITVLSCLVFGYIGVLIFSRVSLWGGAVSSIAYRVDAAKPKVLDTSIIIDGRIMGLLDNNFVEGKIIVPDIVLNELQGIADDSEKTRRKRGRRGLDIVSQIKNRDDVLMEIVDLPLPRSGEATAVDARLVNYTKSIGGVLVTNDFNLSKIADLRGVAVMNLNTLAGDLRRSVLPGELMEVSVVKYGKEHGQGIAYLDDGTMVVVENGNKLIGENITVEVKNIMQSVAGRLIFAMVSGEEIDEESEPEQNLKKDSGKDNG